MSPSVRQQQPPRQQQDTADASTDVADYVSKRIRNLLKRKQKLDKYAEIAANPDSEAKLNADQKNALLVKDQVLAPLKELEELQHHLKAFQLKIDSEIEARVQHARDEARKQGEAGEAEKTRLLVRFLRLASVKRQLASDPPSPEDESFERLLALVYVGDESSLEAVDRLAQGSEELVDPGTETVSFKHIKELVERPVEDIINSLTAEESIASAAEEESKPDTNSDPIFQIPSCAGITFLNESEIETEDSKIQSRGGSVATPEVESAIENYTLVDNNALGQDTEPPHQTIVDDLGANSAASTDWERSAIQDAVGREPSEQQRPNNVASWSVAGNNNNSSNSNSRGRGGRYSRGRGGRGGRGHRGGAGSDFPGHHHHHQQQQQQHVAAL